MNPWNALLLTLAMIGASVIVSAIGLVIASVLFTYRHNRRKSDILPICEDFDTREQLSDQSDPSYSSDHSLTLTKTR